MHQQDIKEPGSTNVDPIFTNNKLPDGNEPGYDSTAVMPVLGIQTAALN